MSGRPAFATLGLAALLVLVTAVAWRLLAPAALPPPSADPAALAQDDDSGPVMDLAHLNEADLGFLAEVLASGEAAPRRSAAKALLISGDLRGAPLLFDAAGQGLEDAQTMCLAGLEILRLQRREDALAVMINASTDPGSLDAACARELDDRMELVLRGSPPLELMVHPDPVVRAWLARYIADEPGERTDAHLLELASDADPSVRRVAWLAWVGRDTAAYQDALAGLARQETDPGVIEVASGVLQRE